MVDEYLTDLQQNRLEIGVIGPNYVMSCFVGMLCWVYQIPPMTSDDIDVTVLPFDQGSKSVSFEVLAREWKEMLLHAEQQCNLSDYYKQEWVENLFLAKQVPCVKDMKYWPKWAQAYAVWTPLNRLFERMSIQDVAISRKQKPFL